MLSLSMYKQVLLISRFFGVFCYLLIDEELLYIYLA